MLIRSFQWFAWFAYLAGSMLILTNSMADYLPGGYGLFISEKGEIGKSVLWRTSLDIHIIGGLLCLFAALPQFSQNLLRNRPAIHRISGRVYGMSMLFLACPTGFHLAFFAKGGLYGKLGFLTLSVAAFHTTLAGWRTVLPQHRDMTAHQAWMTRSFALTASAITFRIYHMLGYLGGFGENTNYVACIWLSMLGNLAVAEWIIHRKNATKFFPQSQPQTEP